MTNNVTLSNLKSRWELGNGDPYISISHLFEYMLEAVIANSQSEGLTIKNICSRSIK
jgi:hypothetical protein